jgi:hypothetical protein
MPGEPVRYNLCTVGTFNVGDFPDQDSPVKAGAEMMLRNSLQERGYSPTEKGSLPSVVLMVAWGRAENSGAMVDLGTVESMSRNDSNYSGNCPSTTARPGFQH